MGIPISKGTRRGDWLRKQRWGSKLLPIYVSRCCGKTLRAKMVRARERERERKGLGELLREKGRKRERREKRKRLENAVILRCMIEASGERRREGQGGLDQREGLGELL